jgi:hypothetical protein
MLEHLEKNISHSKASDWTVRFVNLISPATAKASNGSNPTNGGNGAPPNNGTPRSNGTDAPPS